MDYAGVFELLSTLKIFECTRSDILEQVIRSSYTENFPQGMEILREGSNYNEDGYIIIEGSVDVYIGWKWTKTLGKGSIFGEYAPIFDRNRTASIISKEPLQCLVLSRNTLLMLVTTESGLYDVIFQHIHENIHNERGVFGKI